ncbi:MAG: hypothetical protein ACJAU0_000376 [Flavobacteriales bacterium]|jgi:hypothetical protein
MKERRFMHQSVSNLAWAMRSAPLMLAQPKSPYTTLDENWFAANYELHEEWIWRLDADPKPLDDFLRSEYRLPLGKKFERLIEFWLRESEHFELLANNVQLSEGKETVGEIDFIFKDAASRDVFHMEVACKFYLCSNKSKAWHHWIGPNGNDNLALKMNKLTKQLAITSSPAGKRYLDENKIVEPKPVLFMKGLFFHHYQDLFHSNSPIFSAKNYGTGWWVRLAELDHFFASDGTWMVLQKSDWLSNYETSFGTNEIYESYQMKAICHELIAKYKRSITVIQLFPSEVGYSEGSRGFVVPNHWPDKR